MGTTRLLVTGAAVLAGLGMLTGCGFDFDREHVTDDATITEQFSTIRFNNEAGNVTITTGDRATVTRNISYDDSPPGQTHRVENDVLILDPCPDNDCSIDYEIVVPEGTRVDGVLQSGDADISGVGAINVQSSSGNVSARDIAGAINVEVNSGDVDLVDVTGTTQVRASSGNVTVGLTAPDDVRVEANSGNIEVSVPDGAYRVSANADSGSVDNEIGSDDSAGNHLDLDADSGNITVSRA